MKRIFCLFFLIILCISCFVACDSDDTEETDTTESKLVQLSAPAITKSNGFAVWEAVENATKYEIMINNESVGFVDASTTVYQLDDNQILRVRAIGDGITYSTSNWSDAVFISIELPED